MSNPRVALDVAALTRRVESQVELWKQIARMARWQREAFSCWQEMFAFKAAPWGLSLAPQNLSQAINPQNNAMIQFMLAGRSSSPQTEMAIVTQVASYGSQLGTVIDAVRAVCPPKADRGTLAAADREALEKFESLVERIGLMKDIQKAMG